MAGTLESKQAPFKYKKDDRRWILAKRKETCEEANSIHQAMIRQLLDIYANQQRS